MNNIFGGTFGARLNMNLREEKHWSYGAASLLYGARGQRPFLAYASVQGDKTADTISEMLKEIKGMLGARPVTEEELAKTKQQQIAELPGSHETMNAVGSLIGDLLQFRLPLDYYSAYVKHVSELTVEKVECTAKSVLNSNSLVWLVVGDRTTLEPSLQALGIGEIIRTEA
jgi:zinc protease